MKNLIRFWENWEDVTKPTYPCSGLLEAADFITHRRGLMRKQKGGVVHRLWQQIKLRLYTRQNNRIQNISIFLMCRTWKSMPLWRKSIVNMTKIIDIKINSLYYTIHIVIIYTWALKDGDFPSFLGMVREKQGRKFTPEAWEGFKSLLLALKTEGVYKPSRTSHL